jgi:hypothetical protein
MAEQLALVSPPVGHVERGNEEVIHVVHPGPDRDGPPVDETHAPVAIRTEPALDAHLVGQPIATGVRAVGQPEADLGGGSVDDLHRLELVDHNARVARERPALNHAAVTPYAVSGRG